MKGEKCQVSDSHFPSKPHSKLAGPAPRGRTRLAYGQYLYLSLFTLSLFTSIVLAR